MIEENTDILKGWTDEIVLPGEDKKEGELVSDEDNSKDKLLHDIVNAGTNALMSSFEEQLSSDIVTNYISKNVSLEVPNYVLDMRGIDSMYDFQMEALEILLSDSESDDETINIYAITQGGIIGLGVGKRKILDKLLSITVERLFNNQKEDKDRCRVYKDYVVGEEPKEIKRFEVGKIRLNI